MQSTSGRRVAGLVMALFVVCAPVATGHEIPPTVTVQVLLIPHAEGLTVLLRAPLSAMRDFEWPVRGPGYLDLSRIEPMIDSAARTWLVGALQLESGGRSLVTPDLRRARISLPSDRAFAEPGTAVAHLESPPLPASTAIAPEQALLDVWLEVPGTLDARDLSIETGDLARLGLRTTTVLRLVTGDGGDRLYRVEGDAGRVTLDPRWWQASWRFVVLGFRHILDGLDHLLFLLCLVLPFRRIRPLVPIVTAFTVAHSLTLAASALGLAPRALWFPALIEALIALSIVAMAIENVVGPRLHYRWQVAFGFGLVHGFGFSFALSESLQFAGSHLLAALLAFNLGVEAGQLLVLVILVPMLGWLAARLPGRRTATLVLSVLVAHTAWHWLTERLAELRQYRFALPAADPGWVARGMRQAALLLLVVAVAWALRELFAWGARRQGDGGHLSTGREDRGC